jgi:hypothetical protein
MRVNAIGQRGCVCVMKDLRYVYHIRHSYTSTRGKYINCDCVICWLVSRGLRVNDLLASHITPRATGMAGIFILVSVLGVIVFLYLSLPPAFLCLPILSFLPSRITLGASLCALSQQSFRQHMAPLTTNPPHGMPI